MNVRSLFAAATLCGIVLTGSCGTAQAGVCNILYGYCYGMTFRAECPEGAYCHWSKKHNQCYPNTAGGNGQYSSNSQNGTPTGATNGGSGNGQGNGDYYAPAPNGGMKGVPNGTAPKLQPTPAAPPAGDREAMPRKSPYRAAGNAQGKR